MQSKEQKSFLGILDADSEASYVDKQAWVNSENVRYGTTDAGVIGTVESIGSNVLVSTPSPSVTFIEIGAVDDEARDRIIYFLYNTTTSQHKIICNENGTEYNVLLSSQVVGGLNFDKNKLIHSAKVVNGLLVWVNGTQNEPKCINIDAGIKTNHPSYVTNEDPYATPIKYETTTLIKRPPIFRLQVTKVTDSSFDNNLIATNAYQFTSRYNFRDSQKSALSAFSARVPFNADGESSNAIDVYLSFSEYIDDDVQQVDICVRTDKEVGANNGKVYVVKSYNKNNPTDLTEIQNHNAGISQLGFRFYDDIQGTALGDDERNTSMDNVPIYSLGLELARYRLFLSNYVSGYDTPTQSSLAVTLTNVNTGATGSFAGTWGYITLHANFIDPGIQDSFMFPFVRRTSDNTLYYFPSVRNSTIWNGGVGSVPATINLSEATQAAVNEATLVAYLKATNFPVGSPYGTPAWDAGHDISFASLGAVTVLLFTPVSVNQFFKDNSTYLVNIAFFDRFRRKCGVLKNPVQVSIPIRTWAQTSFTTILQWTLSNTNAADEIPEWAYYYQIHITKNQTTRLFVQSRVFDATYVERGDPASAAPYVFGNGLFSDKTYAVGFDLTLLEQAGLGYSYQDGDFANIFFVSGDPYTLPVIGQYGSWVLLAPYDFGFGLNPDTNLLLELYTPYKSTLNEAYYETGDVYIISNPGTSDRAYSQLVGQINGDVYALQREDKNGGIYPNQLYIVEAMSPNDRKWKIWDTDTGWPNFILQIGQVAKTNSIFWSNTFIEGSKVNNINKYVSLVSIGNQSVLTTNEKDLDNELASIQKLGLTAKVQGEQGNVMLAVCENGTVSLYLGETQQYGSSAQSTLTLSTQVIGSSNVLKGAYGTLNPESFCVDDRGNAFWLDTMNSKFIRYSENGLYPISNDFMTRFWRQFCDQYNSMTESEIEALGSRPFVFTAFDRHHRELLITIPKLLDYPPRGYLPDYPSVIYPFDIWDGQAKTVVYKVAANQAESQNNRWQGSYSITSEGWVTLGSKVYSFKNGQMYLHNQTSSYCNFYGVQYKSKIMFLCNQNPVVPNVYNSIGIDSNLTPTLTYFRSETPYEQASDLVDFDYNNLEGVLYAALYRNKLVPTATGLDLDGLLTAEKIRTNVLRVMLEFTVSSVPLELRFITVSFVPSKGHSI